jgi:hypothetical protein
MNAPQPPADPRRKDANPIPDDAQRVFDTVTGPNLRASDNLIQLAVIAGGAVLCAGGGAAYGWATHNSPLGCALVGGFAGVVLSLFLSGAIIGLVRFVLALRNR